MGGGEGPWGPMGIGAHVGLGTGLSGAAWGAQRGQGEPWRGSGGVLRVSGPRESQGVAQAVAWGGLEAGLGIAAVRCIGWGPRGELAGEPMGI